MSDKITRRQAIKQMGVAAVTEQPSVSDRLILRKS